MKFQREWYFVAYAILLLGLSLFIERSFVDLCPLGAFMVLGGKLRITSPLKGVMNVVIQKTMF